MDANSNKCQYCLNVFASNTTLKRHIQSIHLEDSNHHLCIYCGKKFTRKDHLNRHLTTHIAGKSKIEAIIETKAEFTCDVCGKSFNRKDNLVRHAKLHKKALKPGYRGVPSSSKSVTNNGNKSSGDNPRKNVKTTSNSDRDASQTDDELNDLLHKYHTSIASYYKKGRILDIYNQQIYNCSADIKEQLLKNWKKVTTRIKINCSPGFVLKHKTTGEYRYFHSSDNNGRLFDKPILIKSEDDLLGFVDKLLAIDILEWVLQQRPNSSWKVELVTNISFYQWKILNMVDYCSCTRCYLKTTSSICITSGFGSKRESERKVVNS
ncbi:hypothetical protein EB796_019112 [Bugula neritina]|uniref:C2H2-type domain-containing protein n=1 Tax=Bugula neritina TaxID=10212 RepID=A0A7J7J8L1_BUGNE|nr:hypothetical protein EB796_019112 [Bugula neritina]